MAHYMDTANEKWWCMEGSSLFLQYYVLNFMQLKEKPYQLNFQIVAY